jgi:hypothetical protein
MSGETNASPNRGFKPNTNAWKHLSSVPLESQRATR